MSGIFYKFGNEMNFFAVVIEHPSNKPVTAKIYKLNEEGDFIRNKTGDLIMLHYVKSFGEKVCELEIWNKYYFPVFTNVQNQWYHQIEGSSSTCYMEMLYKVMRFAYDQAIKIADINIH